LKQNDLRKAVFSEREILVTRAALKQLSENENDAMCDVLLQLMKTENFQHATFLSSTLATHLTKQNKVFQAGCFNFAQMKGSVELCINKLLGAAAKSELQTNCKKFDNESEELRTRDDLSDSCVPNGMAF